MNGLVSTVYIKLNMIAPINAEYGSVKWILNIMFSYLLIYVFLSNDFF